MQTVARIFDSLLLEGSKILHRIALAVFKLSGAQLLQANDTFECSMVLQTVTRSCFDRDLLMRIATRKIGSLTSKELVGLRAAARMQLGVQQKPMVTVASNSSQVRRSVCCAGSALQ
jgi:hypothetical protein